jgi:hypothetical protein
VTEQLQTTDEIICDGLGRLIVAASAIIGLVGWLTR